MKDPEIVAEVEAAFKMLEIACRDKWPHGHAEYLTGMLLYINSLLSMYAQSKYHGEDLRSFFRIMDEMRKVHLPESLH